VEEMESVYWVLVRKLEGKRPLGRPRRRWKNNKISLLEVGLRKVEQVAGCCEPGNKLSFPIKWGRRGFLEYMKTSYLLNKNAELCGKWKSEMAFMKVRREICM
jgi:hypothetical protein